MGRRGTGRWAVRSDRYNQVKGAHLQATMRGKRGQLPNVITFLNLLGGVTAIMLAQQSHFEFAAVAIFVAGALDVLDGALARRLHGFNPFGEALDSLADIISFGVAPALLIYQGYLQPWPVLGWIVAGGYVVCGAWRLARFVAAPPAPFFQGLPITMGGMSAASLLFYRDFWSPRLVALVMLGLAVLMISHVRFLKLPSMFGRLPKPAQLAGFLALGASWIAFPISNVIFALGIAYFVASMLENVGFWDAMAGGPVGDIYARLRTRL